MQKTLVLASNNPGKLREFNAMFSEKAIHIVGKGSMGVRACEEPYHTFLENALAKARNAARESGLPALADDSGITANALNGEPGVFSARYAGADCDDKANNAKLVAALKDKTDKRAHYTCVLVALRYADDPEPIVVEAHWNGEIVSEPRGTGGFGYDPYFYLPEFGKTAAELAPEEKNAVSHRGKALRAMLKAIGERWGW